MKKLLLILLCGCFLLLGNSCSNKGEEPTPQPDPDKVTLTEIELKGYKDTFDLTEDFDKGFLEVIGHYSDNTEKEITEYTINSDAFKKGEKGTYTITVTADSKSQTYTVVVGNVADLPAVS